MSERYLQAPLPIQSKPTLQVRHLLQPIYAAPQTPQASDLEPLAEDCRCANSQIHDIGNSLAELFTSPIYCYHPNLQLKSDQNFARWFPEDKSHQTNESSQICHTYQTGISFSSRFEGGNLGAVAKGKEPNQYYIAIRGDANAAKVSPQWFFFQVANAKSKVTVTFQIINCIKPYSSFKAGMKPLIFCKEAWKRSHYPATYRKNSVSSYYSLSFRVEFSEPNQEIYVAHSYPYSYTRLIRFLDGIENRYRDRMLRKTLCKTILGNSVEILTITNPHYLHKKTILLTARVHPGETVSSLVCESLIRFLLSTAPEAEKLRNAFVIKIVPMLNPDGVVAGSYRASLSGDDLNRQWKQPDPQLHPEVHALKKMISSLPQPLGLFIDIHGHSRKKSTFMYGCSNPNIGYLTRELPYVMAKVTSEFNYFSCNFSVPRSKEGTARVSIFESMELPYSYTWEISLCGPIRQFRHYNPHDYGTMGRNLCLALNIYCTTKVHKIEDTEELRSLLLQFYGQRDLQDVGDKSCCGSSSGNNSETDPIQQSLVKPTEPEVMLFEEIKPFIRSKMLSTSTKNTLPMRVSSQTKRQSLITSSTTERLRVMSDDKAPQIKNPTFTRGRESFMAPRVNLQHPSHPHSSPAVLPAINIQDIRVGTMLKNSYSVNLNKKSPPKEMGGILQPNHSSVNYRRYSRQSRAMGVPIFFQSQPRPARQAQSRSNHDVSLLERMGGQKGFRPNY